jgi:predicted ATP-grasp superfamily ATP-dependent carboligase
MIVQPPDIPPAPHIPTPPQGRPLKILFTEGTSLSARHSLYTLGGYHTVDILDPNPLCQCRFSSLRRRFTRSPHYAKDPEGFLQFLANVLKREKYDVVMPTHEQVYLLSKFREQVGRLAGIALPDFAAMETMQNKAHFAQLLAQLDLPQPETDFIRTPADLNRAWQFPIYLKLAHSTAGMGVFRLKNETELKSKSAELEARGLLSDEAEAVVQQPARGNQATVQAVFDHGRLVGTHSFDARKLGVGGMSSARTGANHPIVREHVAKLGAHLSWHGAMFIDYFYDYATGRPEYIECNPRVGETVNAWLSGVNLSDLLARVSIGEHPPTAPVTRSGVRTQQFMMILITAAYDGASRGALRREMKAYRRGEGLYDNAQDELTRPYDDRLSRLPLWWVSMQLLTWPRLAHNIVASTIANYSLPESATEHVRAMRVGDFDGAFRP